MVCEEDLTARCRQNSEHAYDPHLESHWFLQWCLQAIGANEEAVKERLKAPLARASLVGSSSLAPCDRSGMFLACLSGKHATTQLLKVSARKCNAVLKSSGNQPFLFTSKWNHR
jgi:hypothetical protein